MYMCEETYGSYLFNLVMIHKIFIIYDFFGCVTIIKTIHYRILECTRILHVFWNVELRYKHFEKPALMPSMPQLFVTNT